MKHSSLVLMYHYFLFMAKYSLYTISIMTSPSPTKHHVVVVTSLCLQFEKSLTWISPWRTGFLSYLWLSSVQDLNQAMITSSQIIPNSLYSYLTISHLMLQLSVLKWTMSEFSNNQETSIKTWRGSTSV